MQSPDEARGTGARNSQRRPVYVRPLAVGGVAAGILLFCLSLTPSLVPRTPVVQGALGGAAFSIGYALWVLAQRLLEWLGLNQLPARIARIGTPIVYGASGLLILACLWRSAAWQDSVHTAWGLATVESMAPVTVALTALLVFICFLLLGRAFEALAARWRNKSARHLPVRVSKLISTLAALALFAAVIDGVAMRAALRTIDNMSRVADALIPPDIAPPTSQNKTGSTESLVEWEDLGRWGRNYVTSGPTAADIAEFWGDSATEPIRVYIGLNAAPDAAQRAKLAFNELIRVGRFDRAVLVIAMPTGSGWLDPGAMDSLEYITKGDVATVSVQYSYLASPVSVIVDVSHGVEEAQSLFDYVYSHWKTLPRSARPKLYLHGLSLGAYLSQESVPTLDVFAEPFQGALWAGSPFFERRMATACDTPKHRQPVLEAATCQWLSESSKKPGWS